MDTLSKCVKISFIEVEQASQPPLLVLFVSIYKLVGVIIIINVLHIQFAEQQQKKQYNVKSRVSHGNL